MINFLTDLGAKQKELLTQFLFDQFGLPATRQGLSSLITAQKMKPHNWNGYQVLFHGNGIRFSQMSNSETDGETRAETNVETSRETNGEIIDFDFGIGRAAPYASICPYRAWAYFNSLAPDERNAYHLTATEGDFTKALIQEIGLIPDLVLLNHEK